MNNNSHMIKHRYFDLRLDRIAGGVTAAVTNSPAGQTSAPIPLKLSVDLSSFQLDQLSTAHQINLGIGLWYSLFSHPDIAELWRASSVPGSLYLRLTLGDQDLAALPWELLYDPRTARFVALDGQAALIRYLPLPIAASSEPTGRPLRVLFTGCSPASLPRLDVEQEWRRLLEVLSERGMTLAGSTQSGTLSQLASQLMQGVAIWHFAGHGVEGALVFDDGVGNAVSADAFTVGTLLTGAGVQVAVINACRAGAGGGAVSSIAGALLRAGVPVIVAMQSDIPDTAAIAFSQSLYRSIALGHSVEQATMAGRRAIFALGQAAGASWWMPALFSRSDDPVVLVERSPAGTSGGTTGPRTVASHGSAISQGGVAISGQVGGSVVVVS